MSLQSCPTLCDPIDGSQPGSLVPGILQPRTLEWVAISFSNAWKWKVKVKSLSRVQLFEIPWTAACQAPPPMGFSRQEYWSGVPLLSPIEHQIEFYFIRIKATRYNFYLLSKLVKYYCHIFLRKMSFTKNCLIFLIRKWSCSVVSDSLRPHGL